MCIQSTFHIIMKTPRGQIYVAPFGIRSEEALLLLPPSRRPWRPTNSASDFWHILDQNLHFYTVLLPKIYISALKTCCYTNVVSWIRVESKAIKKMVIKSTELLPLDDVADSVNLDRVMKSISNDAMLLEVSCVST